jgi:hypothetical protein
MAVIVPDPSPSFDRPAVTNLLNRWYDAQTSSALRRPRPPGEARQKGGTVFDIQPEMSSTRAVRVLLELSDLLGFEPPKRVIKKGGYRSKEEFVTELSNRLEHEFTKHYASVGSFATDKKETSTDAEL